MRPHSPGFKLAADAISGGILIIVINSSGNERAAN